MPGRGNDLMPEFAARLRRRLHWARMPNWALALFLKPFVALVLMTPGVFARVWLMRRMKDGRLKRLLLRRINSAHCCSRYSQVPSCPATWATRNDTAEGGWLELLAYVRLVGPGVFFRTWTRGIYTSYLGERITGSAFVQIWIYGLMSNRVLARYPGASRPHRP